jgi:hypothetical protein
VNSSAYDFNDPEEFQTAIELQRNIDAEWDRLGVLVEARPQPASEVRWRRPGRMQAMTTLHEEVEADLDANYHKVPIPHPNSTIAIWYVLTVLEDFLRNLFVFSDSKDAQIVEFQVDAQKYSVRYALDRIRRECKDQSRADVPSRALSKYYVSTYALLEAGVVFKLAIQLCSSAHAGSVRFVDKGRIIAVEFVEDSLDKRYAAAELIGHVSLETVDHSTLLYAWARDHAPCPRVVEAIARSTRFVDRKIVYEFQPTLAVALSQELMQQEVLIPKDWRFLWGGAHETTLLINALCIRCAYHWVAVHFGARFHKARGGGESSLLLVISKTRLLSDLRDMCSLKESAISQFVEYLKFGNAVQSPDPALQPIVSLHDGLLAIPCLMFLSCNHDRNLLTLQNRVERDQFNRLSRLFEQVMVGELLEVVRPRWPNSRGNVTIRDGKEFEEIDLLVGDPESKTLLVCECRWMLQPGDPREVQNRKEACWEKVSQLSRKIEWLSKRKVHSLDALGIARSPHEQWKIEGIVVIKTFGGALSRDGRLPVLPDHVFVQGVRLSRSLEHLASWSQSLLWLPQEGVHFGLVPQTMQLPSKGKQLTFFGFQKLCTVREYRDHVDDTLRH